MFEIIYPLFGTLVAAIVYLGITYCAIERIEEWD